MAISYLFPTAPVGAPTAGVGKTLVSSSMIDRVAASLGGSLVEVPVGFKWFVDGLLAGSLGFGGEESAGASFLRRDGTVWTTDKDGIIMALRVRRSTATARRRCKPSGWPSTPSRRTRAPRSCALRRVEYPLAARQVRGPGGNAEPSPGAGNPEGFPAAFMSMGETAENVADKYDVTREEMD